MVANGQLHARSALILYGSETGNAHDVAEELGRITERLHFGTLVSCLDAFEPTALSEYSFVVVVISTTGQGDLPINARIFWNKLLRKKLPGTHLSGVSFVVFGLGDSSYPKFNWAARKLQKRLLQLGANEFYTQGEADDQHPEGLDASFLPWSTGLRQHLLIQFPLAEGVDPIPDDVLLQPKWTLALVEDRSMHLGRNKNDASGEIFAQEHINLSQEPVLGPRETLGNHRSDGLAGFTSQNIVVTLQRSERMTPNDYWQDVRHLVFTSSSSVHYEPGDVITIYPRNCAQDVDTILSIMQWNEIADKLIHFTPGWSSQQSNSYPILPIFRPTARPYMTLRTLLTNHIDLRAIPRRSFFTKIINLTQDQMQKDRLRELTSPEFIDELYDYTSRPRRSILEVLQEFDSVQIPWQWATNILPELRGRQFSIASGGQQKYSSGGRTRFELLVAIVKYKTVIKRLREGVCTRYLASLPLGMQIQVTFQKGGLGITRKHISRPVVLVGPGTGVAPIRALLWERLYWKEELMTTPANGKDENREIGESVLFFGNRKRDADFFFQDEWTYLESNIPLKVFKAFSRDQDKKIYVQDLIKQQSELVFELLYKSGGIMYVCGSSGKMPRSVRGSVVDIFKEVGGMDHLEAEGCLQKMEREGRYKQETW